MARRMLYNNTPASTLLENIGGAVNSLNTPGEQVVRAMTVRAYRHGQQYALLQLKRAAPVLERRLARRLGQPSPGLRADSNIRMLGYLDYALNLPPDQQVLALLEQRSLTNLRGINAEMSKRITNELSEGILHGEGVDKLAERITAAVDSIGVNRARLIARTETMRAVNQAALNRYYEAHVENVMWLAGADDRCCDTCMAYHQKVFPITGVPEIPVHPNCRCTLAPIVEAGLDDVAQPVAETPPSEPVLETGEDALREVTRITAAIDEELKKVEREMDAIRREGEPLEAAYEAARQEWQDALMDPATPRERLVELARRKDELWQKWSDNADRLVPLDEQRHELWEKRDAELRAMFTQRDTSILAYTTRSRVLKNSDEMRRGLDFVGRVVDREQLESTGTVTVAYKHDRAKADLRSNTILIDKLDGEGVYVHELGHIIEANNPAVHKACVEFYEKRTAGEPLISMSEATGIKGYRSNEVTRRDKFMDPYIGKDYSVYTGDRYATEIYSMGLQYLYERPDEFAARDPEMFKFIVDLAWGNIR